MQDLRRGDAGWVEGYFDSRGRFGKAYGPCPCGATHWLPMPPAPEEDDL